MQRWLRALRTALVVGYPFVIALALAAVPAGTFAQETGSCGDVCDGRPCTGFLLRSGTCQPGGSQCICVPNTPAPGECALACDARPCVGQCSDGTMASGSCTFMTVDTGCRCALVCADSTPTPTPPASTPTPTVALGACAAACDSRPCVGRCPDGSLAPGICASLTIDRGCACTLDCPGVPRCAGDCNGDGRVTVNELMLGISIALGAAPLAECPAADADRDGRVTITDLLAAVEFALVGVCPGSAAAAAPS